MTHPLVSAFHRMRSLEAQTENDHLPGSAFALQSLNELDVFVFELVAATPIIPCYVGFLVGANEEPYAIWLWPLNEAAAYQFWVDDETYDRHNPCIPGRYNSVYVERIVLPHFLRG